MSVSDSPFEDVSGTPGGEAGAEAMHATPGGTQGPLGYLTKQSHEPLEAFDGLSIKSLAGKWDKHLDRAVHTLGDAAPGMVWIDLVKGGIGAFVVLAQRFRNGEEEGINRTPGTEIDVE